MVYRYIDRFLLHTMLLHIKILYVIKTKSYGGIADTSATVYAHTIIIIIVDRRYDYVRYIVVFFDDLQFHSRSIRLVSVIPITHNTLKYAYLYMAAEKMFLVVVLYCFLNSKLYFYLI